MASNHFFYRETTPRSPSHPARYRPSDFPKLTNRRLTTPGFTPDFRFALEPRGQSFEQASSVSTSDKRALSSSHGPAGLAGATGQSSSIKNSSSTCVKEDNSGIAQSFLESVNASIAPQHEPILDASPTEAGSCECCCRCGRGAKWQPVGRKTSRRSKSYSALRTGISELSGWDLELPRPHESRPIEVEKHFGPGQAPLERLPVEVLDDIIGYLAIDLPPSGYGPRNVDLISCLLTSKTIHVATINTLYRQITFPHSQIFSKFLAHLTDYPGRGELVRRLDLSHFTSVGLGRSRQNNAEIQNLTSKSLLRCLELTPVIQEVLLQENLDDDIDQDVIQKMFLDLPKLQAVDFCAASSGPFVNSFLSTLNTLGASPSTMLGIKRLSLHECFTLPSSAFETLLPRLTRLTHLDVSHTRITDRALASLPNLAELSHLNLGRCIHVTGEGVVDFLENHPAVQSLVYLNLSADTARYRLLWEDDVDRLLPVLPASLQSLNLNGAQINSRHIPQLIPLTKHLEELGLASAELSLADITAFFRPPQPQTEVIQMTNSSDLSTRQSSASKQPPWTPPKLHYLDLSSISAITQNTLFNSPAPNDVLLSHATLPLEVIELGDKAISSLRECRNSNRRLGWCVKELGRRGWYVREPINGIGDSRGGKRGWKMGAMWWGMRKVPVAWGEVGGLYGHYMFKK